MSIFTINNISYGESPIGSPGDTADRDRNILNGGLDPTLSPALSRRGGGYQIVRYPIDIGNYDKGHYMLFHINEQRETGFAGRQVNNGDKPTIIRNEELTGLSRWQVSGGGTGGGSVSVTPGNTIQFQRPIRRITETIALYMPDSILYDFSQQYSDTSMSGPLAGGLAAAMSLKDGQKQGGGNNSGDGTNNLAPFAKTAAAEFAKKYLGNEGFIGGIQQNALGFMMNPALELLYTSPQFRTFSFDFTFYPRDEKEAKQVQAILKLLRYHQAPEVKSQTGGFFLIPPSEFDIKFYYNGKQNPNLPPISTCVLNSINVDYAPNGWSAYEKLGDVSTLEPMIGETGMPVAIRLRLQFKETEIVTKQYVLGTERMSSFRD